MQLVRSLTPSLSSARPDADAEPARANSALGAPASGAFFLAR